MSISNVKRLSHSIKEKASNYHYYRSNT